MESDDSITQHLIKKCAFSHLTTASKFEFNSPNNFWQEEIRGRVRQATEAGKHKRKKR